MFSVVLSLIIITIPLWACAIYVRLVLQDDLAYFFEGWQPKAALLVFASIIFVIYFMPLFLDAQIAVAVSGRASRLFSLVPSVGAAMVIFPEVFATFTGLDKIGAEESTINNFYRGLGWVFLGGVFVLMWLL